MRLVSTNEAARILGVSRDTIIRYLRAGKFKTVVLSKSEERELVRIDLASWFVENGIDPTPYLNEKEDGEGEQC